MIYLQAVRDADLHGSAWRHAGRMLEAENHFALGHKFCLRLARLVQVDHPVRNRCHDLAFLAISIPAGQRYRAGGAVGQLESGNPIRNLHPHPFLKAKAVIVKFFRIVARETIIPVNYLQARQAANYLATHNKLRAQPYF